MIENGASAVPTRFAWEWMVEIEKDSRFDGLKPKKTNIFCTRCQVVLCKDCFRSWCDEEGCLHLHQQHDQYRHIITTEL
jgi:hypothetical protein